MHLYLRGFKGCLFSHSGSPLPQALPEICIRGDSVPIHGPALRLMYGPSYVYEMHGCCSHSSEAKRNARPELSQRLASFSPIRERAAQRQVQTPRSYSELRADCKYAKEHAGTEPEHLLFRSEAELNQNASASVGGGHSQKLISSLKLGRSPPLKCFQWTLGQMAAASTVCNLGLLHMRLLQLWLKSRVPQNAWHKGTLRIKCLVYTAGLDVTCADKTSRANLKN